MTYARSRGAHIHRDRAPPPRPDRRARAGRGRRRRPRRGSRERGVGQQERGAGVLQHAGDALRRIHRVQRQVRGAGLEDAQQRGHHRRVAVHVHAHDRRRRRRRAPAARRRCGWPRHPAPRTSAAPRPRRRRRRPAWRRPAPRSGGAAARPGPGRDGPAPHSSSSTRRSAVRDEVERGERRVGVAQGGVQHSAEDALHPARWSRGRTGPWRTRRRRPGRHAVSMVASCRSNLATPVSTSSASLSGSHGAHRAARGGVVRSPPRGRVSADAW